MDRDGEQARGYGIEHGLEGVEVALGAEAVELAGQRVHVWPSCLEIGGASREFLTCANQKASYAPSTDSRSRTGKVAFKLHPRTEEQAAKPHILLTKAPGHGLHKSTDPGNRDNTHPYPNAASCYLNVIHH